MKIKYSLFIVLVIGSITAKGQFHLEVEKLKGDKVTLQELKGQNFTILDFWATWCQPCVKSIPELIKINNEYREKGVQLIGVNTDGPRNLSKVEPFVNSMGINYPIIMDTDQDLMREFGVAAMPTLLIINGEGEIVFAHEGYRPGDEYIVREELDNLLSENE